MRPSPAEFELRTAESLKSALTLMSQQPGAWLPIAGGTDLMVQFGAGALPRRKLLNICELRELRQVEISAQELRIGACCTYTTLREHKVIAREFPLLARAAAWTGGIANQNRGTIGGNIANASPAADSPPALLAYDAELILVSARGQRRIAYVDFHTGYKRMHLEPDELIQAVCLPRNFSGYCCYTRKVGSRNAQAISKVCIAALAKMECLVLKDVRIAVGSVAPVPLRLGQTERVLKGNKLEPAIIAQARKIALTEVHPITDVRSTAQYRSAVVSNLLEEFSNHLMAHASGNGTLAHWNMLPMAEAEAEIVACCGSHAWAHGMAECRPFASKNELFAASDNIWLNLGETDWMEAFRTHPRIGQCHTEENLASRASSWSTQEQNEAAAADPELKMALEEANRRYEKRFGRVFIVCATGKPASEILQILQHRLHYDAQQELRETVEQQLQITHIRLDKWLAQ